MNLTKLKKWFERVARGDHREEALPTRSMPSGGAPDEGEKPCPPPPTPSRQPAASRAANPPARKKRVVKPSATQTRTQPLSRQGIPILRPDEDLAQHFMARADELDDARAGKASALSAPDGKPDRRPPPRSSSRKASKAAPHRNKAGVRQLDSHSDLNTYFLPTAPQPTLPSRRPATREEPDRPQEKTGRRPVVAATTDRHGIPRLDDRADLRRYFETALEGVDDRATAGELEDVFRTSLDHDARRLMKKKTGGVFPPRRLTLKEKLRRYPAPQAQLDLHGDTALIARQRAESFLQTAVADGSLTVCLIVGKGLHSEGGAVLPDVIEDLLVLLKREGRVLAYRWDKGAKRKSGAVIVYLEPPY